jgi:membrane protein implicated in regulation of membrane protease activity
VALVWLAVALIFAVVEVATTSLVGGFITLGALAAAVVAFLGIGGSGAAGYVFQAIVFAVVSILGLVAVRPPLMGYLKSRHGPQTLSGAYGMVGQSAVVVDPIRGAHDRGHVRINGEDWPAMTLDGSSFDAGAVVRVIDINKATLIVDQPPAVPPASGHPS